MIERRLFRELSRVSICTFVLVKQANGVPAEDGRVVARERAAV